MTAAVQRTNVALAALALADLSCDHQIIIAHGNGPQVGLLALQGTAYDPDKPWPLDVLGAETEGMIGYLIEQELMNALPDGSLCATLLSRVEVDAKDPAFDAPSKPIGPVYSAEEAAVVAKTHGWKMVTETSGGMRRVVPSPLPQRIIGLGAIKVLLDAQHTVICAGGGGIPVMRNKDGNMEGVEAVIDKDRTSALLASELQADALLLLTDVVMPGSLQGPELAESVLLLYPDLRIVFMSGYPKGIDQSTDGPTSGFTKLMKPISLAMLSQTLHNEFERSPRP